MAHNLDESTGRAAIAFRGSRDNIWHRHGQQFQDGWTMDDWRRQAGLDWECVKVPALADVTQLPPHPRLHAGLVHGPMKVNGDKYLARTDNAAILGHCSDRYQPVQPKELFDWFEQYVGADDRFRLDVAGALKKGAIIWATATFNGGMDVAGDKHTARLLMTTSYDAAMATWNRATMTRVVCNNTLDAAMADKGGGPIRTSHRQKFDRERVGAELARVIQQFDRYRAMGEAMAARHIAAEDLGRMFKHVLDIPFDAKKEDLSANKQAAWDDMRACYSVTKEERGGEVNMFTALQSVTRYADHNKPTRGRDGADERRFLSANFGGAGEAMKREAVAYLDEISDGDLLRAAAEATAAARATPGGVSGTDDVADLLRQPFRTSH